MYSPSMRAPLPAVNTPKPYRVCEVRKRRIGSDELTISFFEAIQESSFILIAILLTFQDPLSASLAILIQFTGVLPYKLCVSIADSVFYLTYVQKI